MNDDPKRRRELPEFVDDLVRLGVDELQRSLGTPPDQAKLVMGRIAGAIVTAYARHTMYVPAGFDTRNEEIYRKHGEASATAAAYSQDRISELAAEYGLTSRQVYNIVGAMRARDIARRQPRLPGFEGA